MADAKSKPQLDITPIPPADPLLSSASSNSPAVVGYLAAFVMTAVATVLAVSVDLGVTIPNLSLIFVVPVVITGVSFGLGPSLCSAILGALAYNFFLTEPRYSLAVNDPANIWAIALLFIVGLIVSGVAYTSGRRAADAALLRRQTIVLQGYSRDVVAADKPEAIVSLTSEALAAVFEVPVVVMLVTDDVVSVKKMSGPSSFRRSNWGRRSRRWRRRLSCALESTRLLPRALTFGPWQRRRANAPSLDSHSTPTSVLRSPIRWSISFGVFWSWHLTASFSRLAAMPGPQAEGAILCGTKVFKPPWKYLTSL